MSVVRARVFEKDGNRFIIPRFWYSEDDSEIGGSHLTCTYESMLFSVVINAKPVDWIDITANENGYGGIPHFSYQLVGLPFALGAIEVMMIGGPLFDEEMSEHKTTTEPEPQTPAT